MPEARPRLYLIDGYSNIFRAFYAIRHLSNSKGEPTNAVYGLAQMLVSGAITLLLVLRAVSSAVHFDHQSNFSAEEIRDKLSDRMLSAKAHT